MKHTYLCDLTGGRVSSKTGRGVVIVVHDKRLASPEGLLDSPVHSHLRRVISIFCDHLPILGLGVVVLYVSLTTWRGRRRKSW